MREGERSRQTTYLSSVRLRFPPPPNLGSEQSQLLLIRPLEYDPRRLRGRHGDPPRDIHINRMRIPELQIQTVRRRFFRRERGMGGRTRLEQQSSEGRGDLFDVGSVPYTD